MNNRRHYVSVFALLSLVGAIFLGGFALAMARADEVTSGSTTPPVVEEPPANADDLVSAVPGGAGGAAGKTGERNASDKDGDYDADGTAAAEKPADDGTAAAEKPADDGTAAAEKPAGDAAAADKGAETAEKSLGGATLATMSDEAVTTEEQLRAAIPASGSADIVVSGEIALSANNPVTIPSGVTVTITSENGGKVSATSGTAAFVVEDGATLALGQGLSVYSGGTAAVKSSGAVVVNGAELVGGSDRTTRATIFLDGAGASLELSSGTVSVDGKSNVAGLYARNGASARVSGGSIVGLVYVYNADLDLGDGEIKAATTAYTSYSGVTIEARGTGAQANFNMSGGTISGFKTNNGETGGGVTLRGGDYYSTPASAVMRMSGGTIRDNETTPSNSGGGGVYVLYGAEFFMTGGTISNNRAYMGGGVATNDGFYYRYGSVEYESKDPDWPNTRPGRFEMRGGTISDNRATGSGGGIYSLSKCVDLYAGNIVNNVAGNNGGGLYTSITPFLITLYDATITGNTARVIGGGAWFCPTGDVDAEITDGAANYGNTAGQAGDDLAVAHTGSTTIRSVIAERMLGGGPANWHYDGRVNASWANVQGTGFARDFNGPYEHNWNGLSSIALKAHPTDESIALANTRTKLLISGNRAGWGGGIGANGHTKVGTNASKKVTVTKAWGVPDGGNVQALSSVTVHLEITGDDGVAYNVEQVTLDASNDWKHTFEGLPLHAKVDIVEDELSSPNGWVTYYYDGGEVVDDDTHTHEAISVTNARAGSLELSKRVSGNSADPNDVFEYRVNITDADGKPFVGRDAEGEPFEFSYRLSGTSDSVSTGSIKNGDTVRLRAGQKIVISDIPHGAHYSVKETADSAMGYEIEPVRSDGVVGADAEEGTIVGDATTSIAYENVRNRDMGALSVSKSLAGDAADPSQEFRFVARFYHPDGTELTEGEFAFVGDEEGIIASGHEFSLRGGDKVTIAGLPTGTRWEIKEVAATAHGHEIEPSRGEVVGPEAESGTVETDVTAELSYTNVRNRGMGALAVSKSLAGDAADPSQEFRFVARFYHPDGTELTEGEFAFVGDEEGIIASGHEFSLRGGESIEVSGLPEGTRWEIKEVAATAHGHEIRPSRGEVVGPEAESGTIETDVTAELSYTNERNRGMGALAVSKSLAGDAADPSQEFHFVARFYEADGSEVKDAEFAFVGDEEGIIASGHEFTLRGGDKVTIAGLPEGTRWEVKEVAGAAHGYEILPVQGERKGEDAESGTIAAGETAELSYTNEKNRGMGALSVSKTVASGDQERDFEFRVTLGDAASTDANETTDAEFAYTGDREGIIASGGIIKLSHGQSVLIEGLPAGTPYRVEEVNATDYSVTTEGEVGTVEFESTSKASFVNRVKETPVTSSKLATPATSKTKVPQTGDSLASGLQLTLAMASLAAFAAAVRLRRTSRRG